MDELDVLKSNKFLSILDHAYSLQRSRTDFQIEHFVLGQHDTKPMQFHQVCMEIVELSYNIRIGVLELEKMSVRRQRLLESNDPVDALDAQILDISIERSSAVLHGSLDELNSLIACYESFPHKYLRSEIESDQLNYWKNRLVRQAALEESAVSTAHSEHLNSLLQAGILHKSMFIGSKAQHDSSVNSSTIQDDLAIEMVGIPVEVSEETTESPTEL